MFQRSNVSSMSASRGELGKYVNRLGWAVSSEEQRLAALGRIKQYAQTEGITELEQLVTKIQAATSLVFNPEGAIDAAVGADMKINLAATNRELLMAFNLTRDAGFSEEMAQSSLGNALFSLMSEDDSANLYRIAREAGIEAHGMDKPSIVRAVLAKNNQFSEELIGLINLTSENVGNALISNTAKQVGMIRALQELYPDIDFSGIGMVGFDDFATNLKLSGITSEAEYGDINRVIDSIATGGQEVFEAHGMDTPETSVINQINNLTRAGGKERISGEQAKLRLLNLIGLDDEAQKNFGTLNVQDVMDSVNAKMSVVQKRLGRVKYNQYAPSKQLADIFNEKSLNQAMDELTGVFTTRLESSAGLVEKSMEDLVIESNLLRDIEDVRFNGFTLAPRSRIRDRLINRGFLSETEIDRLVSIKSRSAYEQARAVIINKLKTSESFAQQEAGTAIQEFFTAHIQRFQAKAIDTRPEDVMEKILFEIEEMKNATRIANPTIIQETRRAMGFMFENALSSDQPIMITVPGMKEFSLQQLSAFVRTKNELRLTRGAAAKETDDMVALVEALVSKRSDPDLSVPRSLMDKKFLSQLFEVDRRSATNAEIGVLERVPKLVNAEEVQDVLNGMTESSIDLEFLEDFLAFDGEDLDPTGGVIGQRIRNASTGKAEKDIAKEISNRIRLIGSIRRRYDAVLETQRPEYSQFNAILEGGEVTAEGIVTPGLRGDAGERSMGTIDEAVQNMLDNFKFEIDDEADRAARVAIASTYADPGSVASGKYTRIQDFMKSPQMKELYEGALKNKGKIAGVAAIATGLAIFGSINKKERTQEAMSGPPLLPGGNPYERIPNSPMGFSDAPISQNGQGMSYNISVDGDQDNMEQFMNRARISNKWECPRYYA
jgi:hypothetical protein